MEAKSTLRRLMSLKESEENIIGSYRKGTLVI